MIIGNPGDMDVREMISGVTFVETRVGVDGAAGAGAGVTASDTIELGAMWRDGSNNVTVVPINSNSTVDVPPGSVFYVEYKGRKTGESVMGTITFIGNETLEKKRVKDSDENFEIFTVRDDGKAFVTIPPGISSAVTIKVESAGRPVAVKEVRDICIRCTGGNAVPALWVPSVVLSVDGVCLLGRSATLTGTEIVRVESNYTKKWEPNTEAGEKIMWTVSLGNSNLFRVDTDPTQRLPSSGDIGMRLRGHDGPLWLMCIIVDTYGNIVRQSMWSPVIHIRFQRGGTSRTGGGGGGGGGADGYDSEKSLSVKSGSESDEE